jgi:hypothetical protein
MATMAVRARGVALGLLGEWEVVRERGRERRRDRGQRAAARLRATEAEPVRRDDEHWRLERADGLELVAHGRDVGLRVRERLRLSARVALVREQNDLDRVPARRRRVEHAAQPALDREVGRRGVRREQRVRLEVVGRRVAVCQRPGGADQRSHQRHENGKEGRCVSAPPASAIGRCDRPTASG